MTKKYQGFCFLIHIREFYYEIMGSLASFGMTRHVSGTRGKKWRFIPKESTANKSQAIGKYQLKVDE